MEFKHVPIMLDEVIEGLCIKEDGVYIDGTIGGAGHSKEIIKKLKKGKLIGIDRDEEALKKADEVLSKISSNYTLLHDNYVNMDSIAEKMGIEKVDGILLDIGVSSYQLDNDERGFSYNKDARLDMRMDKSLEISAYDIVNFYDEKRIEDIIFQYGEERWAKRIAQFIVEERKKDFIESTFELVNVIKKAIPKKAREDKHPAKKTFQALRIEVNEELDVLEKALLKAINLLKTGGRFAVITFHSLEDRLVKKTFKLMSTDCICPPHQIICTCNHKKSIKLINTKPIVASKKELESNRRAKSAKLRIVEKI